MRSSRHTCVEWASDKSFLPLNLKFRVIKGESVFRPAWRELMPLQLPQPPFQDFSSHDHGSLRHSRHKILSHTHTHTYVMLITLLFLEFFFDFLAYLGFWIFTFLTFDIDLIETFELTRTCLFFKFAAVHPIHSKPQKWPLKHAYRPTILILREPLFSNYIVSVFKINNSLILYHIVSKAISCLYLYSDKKVGQLFTYICTWLYIPFLYNTF